LGAILLQKFVKIKLHYRSIKVNIIGPNIRQYRKIQDLTQEQLVARCNLNGWNISRSTLAKIESQVRRVTDIEVKLLATALEIKVQELFDNSLTNYIKT